MKKPTNSAMGFLLSLLPTAAELQPLLGEVLSKGTTLNKYTPHQGKQECTRRRAQIARGQLKISN